MSPPSAIAQRSCCSFLTPRVACELQLFVPRHWTFEQGTCARHPEMCVSFFAHRITTWLRTTPFLTFCSPARIYRLDHGAKLHDIPDEHLGEILKTLKKIAVAQGVENYNILQVRTACFFLFLATAQGLSSSEFHLRTCASHALVCVLAEQWPHRAPRSRRACDSRSPPAGTLVL